MRKWPLVLVVFLLPVSAFADVTDIVVDELTFVEEQRTQRFSRMSYYLYTVTVTNNGPALQDVTARVTSTARTTRVTDRMLSFGDVAQGATAVSTDTFALGLRRGQTLDQSVLVFSFSGTEVVATDTVPPVIVADISPPANLDGWHNTDVTVSFTCTDDGSGVASCAAPVTLSVEGEGQLVTGESTDNAGNSAAVSVSINIDKTAPAVSFGLAAGSDVIPLADDATLLQRVSLFGMSDPGRLVELFRSDDLLTPLASVVAAADGSSYFSSVLLGAGGNPLTMQVTDQAGNTGRTEKTIQRAQCLGDSATPAFLVDSTLVPTAGAEVTLYDPSSSAFAGDYTQFGVAGAGNTEVLAADINADGALDWVLPVAASDTVRVFINDGGSVLAAPLSVASGASGPVSVAVADFVGGALSDIAIGHTDGSVTFLEGLGGGTFALHAASTVSGLGIIQKLLATDLDSDGDIDLVVSGGGAVKLLLNNDDIADVSVVANGDFSDGLSAWQVSVAGHAPDDLPGSVNAQGDVATLSENQSFRTTLQQTFQLPAAPAQLSFDLTALGLDLPAGGVPDAFEVSLLNANNGSVVPTVDALATSFLNINPNGVVSTAPGVTFDGLRVSLDVSAVAPATDVTLYFDLIGNPPGSASFASVDNVDAGTTPAPGNGFIITALPGPLVASRGVDYCALSNDTVFTLIVDDPGQGQIFIYEGDGSGGFVRSQSLPQGGL